VSKTIEFFFDFGSPYSYMANTQLPAIAEQTGATITYSPVGILRLMELAGNRPTTLECKNKRRYAAADLSRWAKLYGVPMGRNPYLKDMKLEPLLQGALAANAMGVAGKYVSAVFKGIYADALDLGDPAVFARVLGDAGLDGQAILAARDSDERASDLAKRTENAVERGLFGVPTFIVDGQLYFGNDRLQFVKAALAS
jgi:2-hydroxychromene-2-carboxylate isomerase